MHLNCAEVVLNVFKIHGCETIYSVYFFLYQCIATFCPDDVQEFLMDCFISLLHGIMMMYETLLVCVLSKCGYCV